MAREDHHETILDDGPQGPIESGSAEHQLDRHPSDAPWEHLPTSPWRLLAGIAVLVLVVDLLLGMRTRTDVPRDLIQVVDRGDMHEVFEQAAEEQAWLLLGDSVLAGDVLAGRVDDWTSKRVIDHMRAGAGEDAPALRQLALNGILPRDLLGIVAELDRVDPNAEIPLLIELNPRYFSSHYADDTACAHPWLCERLEAQTQAQAKAGVRGRWALARLTVRDGLDQLAEWLPIYRHRRYLVDHLDAAKAVEPLPGRSDGDPDLAGNARILAHYRRPALGRKSTQIKALRALVARLAKRDRRAVFFMTPLNDAFFDGSPSPSDLGRVSSAVAKIVNQPGSTNISLLELDHPMFRPEHFVDHCHLWPDGNRILAQNLLHQLGINLRSLPPPTEMILPESPDSTLVAQVRSGYADGPSWVARFAGPRGVALGPNGQVVIADTGNNALRILDGNLQTVRTWVGGPARKKMAPRKGPIRNVRLAGPRHPVFLGEDLYFTTAGGKTLNRLSGDVVETIDVVSSEVTRIEALRADGSLLFVLDEKRRIWAYDPAAASLRLLVSADTGRRIKAFAVDRAGHLFLADEAARVIEIPVDGPACSLAPGVPAPPGTKLHFANDGAPLRPEFKKGSPQFPLPMPGVKIDAITELHWVERYGGLLATVEDRPEEKTKIPIPERFHLWFFDLVDQEIYPWIKPVAFGGAYLMWTNKPGVFVSPFHEGSVAVDPQTAAIYHLELGRSRLVRISDGLLGASKIGQSGAAKAYSGTREMFGNRAGRMSSARFETHRFLAQRGDPWERAGPYVVLLQTTSMSSTSDRVGMYSLGRVLERRLRDQLGMVDGIRIDLFQRVKIGLTFQEHVAEVEARAAEVPPDVIMVELYETANPNKRRPMSQEQLENALLRLGALGRHYDAKVYVLDVTSWAGWQRDGLHPPSERANEQLETIRRFGIEVVSLEDLLLHDLLEGAPWGSPPYTSHHLSPWSVDVAAGRLAEAIYPGIRDHFEARTPAWRRELTPFASDIAPAATRPEWVPADAVPEAWPIVAATELLTRRDGRTLEVFVDLRGHDAPDQDALARLAAGALISAVGDDPTTTEVDRITVRLARFGSYDEYGEGLLEDADTEFEAEFTRASFAALLSELRADR